MRDHSGGRGTRTHKSLRSMIFKTSSVRSRKITLSGALGYPLAAQEFANVP